jgi:hypothetical protein
MRAQRLGRHTGTVFIVLSLLTAHAAARGDDGANPAREAWRIDVAPFAVLGSGRPGTLPADIDKPDGLAFTASGLLLVTDAGNRRIQVWDPKMVSRVGEFGRDVFGGEITNIAVGPDGTVCVADSVLNLVYVWGPPKPGAPAADYTFVGTRYGDERFRKLGGMTFDERGRLYIADGKLWEVRRYGPDGRPDPTWHFERSLADGDTVLHRCEGIAVDEKRGLLYVASESDFVIKAFDLETGAFRRTLVGARADRDGRPVGTRVFGGPVEGLEITRGLLFAADESVGRIHVFRLDGSDLLGSDLDDFTAAREKGDAAYIGYFGHAPRVNFDVDDTPNPDMEMHRKVMAGEIIPGMVNPPGEFCSPDEVAVYAEPDGSEAYVAVADQCNFRVVVYRWSDLQRALGGRARPASHAAP